MKTKANQRIRNFNKRWNIVLDDKAEFIKFRSRVAHAVDQIVAQRILQNSKITYKFNYLVGNRQTASTMNDLAALTAFTSLRFEDNDVYRTIADASSMPALVAALQHLFWVLEEFSIAEIRALAGELRQTIALSPTIDISIAQHGDHVTLYPGGAKLLDEKVVNETLEWLDDYPQVSKHLEEALLIYQTKDVKRYRNLLDNLRLAVEQLLRALLKNRKSLENQGAPLAKWLEAHSVHKQVQNMYGSLLFGPYAMYQNDAVKHGDESSPVEVEYMIYLTGTFIRFLLQVNQETAHGS